MDILKDAECFTKLFDMYYCLIITGISRFIDGKEESNGAL